MFELIERPEIIELKDFYYCDGQPVQTEDGVYLNMMGWHVGQGNVLCAGANLKSDTFSCLRGNRTWTGYDLKNQDEITKPWYCIDNPVKNTTLGITNILSNGALCMVQWENYNGDTDKSGIGQLWLFQKNGYRWQPVKPVIKHWQPENKPDPEGYAIRGTMGADCIVRDNVLYCFYGRDLQWQDFERNRSEYPGLNDIFFIETIYSASLCVARSTDWGRTWHKWYHDKWEQPGLYGYDTTICASTLYHHKFYKGIDNTQYVIGQKNEGYFDVFKVNWPPTPDYPPFFSWQMSVKLPYKVYYPLVHSGYLYYCIDINHGQDFQLLKLARQKIILK